MELILRGQLVSEFGTEGLMLASNVTMALGGTFGALVLLASLMAYWHAMTGIAALPVGGGTAREV